MPEATITGVPETKKPAAASFDLGLSARAHYSNLATNGGNQVMLVAINSSDGERNPLELGVMASAIKRVKNGRYVLLPGCPDTGGHGTTGMAKLWKQHLVELIQQAPRR